MPGYLVRSHPSFHVAMYIVLSGCGGPSVPDRTRAPDECIEIFSSVQVSRPPPPDRPEQPTHLQGTDRRAAPVPQVLGGLGGRQVRGGHWSSSRAPAPAWTTDSVPG